MAKSPSADHIDAAKRRLVHLSGLAGRTRETERRILAAAEERYGKVASDLDRLRPRVNLDPAAASQYQALALERGQLARVIAQAQEALA